MFGYYVKTLPAFMYRVRDWRGFCKRANVIADRLGVEDKDIPPTHKKAFRKLRSYNAFWCAFYRLKFHAKPYYKRIGRLLGLNR